MNPSLILKPDVFVIGQTQFNVGEFDSWLSRNNHGDDGIGFDDGNASPIANLWRDVRDDFALERMIEFGGRHCYRAWDTGRSRFDYVRNIIEMDHGSVLEHSTVNLALQGVSRSLSLELVRHRVGCSPSQESQRYVDAKDMLFVVPPILLHLNEAAGGASVRLRRFEDECMASLHAYVRLQQSIISEIGEAGKSVKDTTALKKRANEAARSLLPNAAETRLLWSANMRLLRHVFWLRGGNAADLEIRRLAVAIFDKVRPLAPSVFSDMALSFEDGSYGVPVIVAANA